MKAAVLTPTRFERAGDAAMPDALARELGWEVIQSELLFEGGNIVVPHATGGGKGRK